MFHQGIQPISTSNLHSPLRNKSLGVKRILFLHQSDHVPSIISLKSDHVPYCRKYLQLQHGRIAYNLLRVAENSGNFILFWECDTICHNISLLHINPVRLISSSMDRIAIVPIISVYFNTFGCKVLHGIREFYTDLWCSLGSLSIYIAYWKF